MPARAKPTGLGLAVRAVRQKLRAVTALGTFWPAVVRGGKLLARGQVRAFAGKLFNERATVRAAAAALEWSGPPLVLAGHILRPGGYDHVVHALLKGLIRAGVSVRRDPLAVIRPDLVPAQCFPPDAVPGAECPRLAATPPHLLHRFAPDRRTVAFTMWETDTLPTGAVAALNHCGLVVVPSKWGAACFSANGVTVPVEVVPLGVDPAVFSPGPGASNGIVFGTAGALDAGGLRKNVPRVVDLFRRAFPIDCDARLRVKITPDSPDVVTHGDPRIDVIRHSLAPEELADWYRSLTAFVNASHGEGFGLHLLETMACGRPLVSATLGGVGAFFDATVGYEVDYRVVEARNAIYTGRWADPDDEGIIAQMRRIHADRGEAERRGRLAAERAARFTWDDTIRKLMVVMSRHQFIGE